MARIITIFSGQFSDYSLEELCQLVCDMGYEGIELATGEHFNIQKALHDDSYIPYVKNMLSDFNLKCHAISAHPIGQCIGDVYDERLDRFVPAKLAGKPEEIKAWAIAEMKDAARAAKKFGVKVINGFMGSPIWARWYPYPSYDEKVIEDGFQKIFDLWSPIFDVFDECGVKFALEVHPTEIAFDYYTTERLLKKFNYRETLGINFDPSHLVWQGVNEVTFVRDFARHIYHVHLKDVKKNKNDRAGILGSFIPFGDSRRAWDFVSLGHGDVDFDGIIRELNKADYQGPLSVEWEDLGMNRIFGATESCLFAKKMNFNLSTYRFDIAQK